MVCYLSAQKAVNYFIIRGEILYQPSQEVKMIMVIFTVDNLFQFIFTLKWTYWYHFIFAVIVSLFATDVTFAKFSFSSSLVMNTHDFLSIFVKFICHPTWILVINSQMIFYLVDNMINLQMDQSFNWLFSDFDKKIVVDFLQNWRVKRVEPLVSCAF